MPVLARLMRTDHTDLRAPATRLLGSIGTADAGVVLSEALADPDPERRLETIQALRSFGGGATFVVPMLIERLSNDTVAAVRQAILRLLVAIEPKSERVLQAKLSAFRDVSADLRRAAVSLLRSPDPVPFLGVFKEAVSDQDAGVREEAMRGLSQIGLSLPGAIPALCEALMDPRTHDAAIKAIGQVSARAGWKRPGDTAATLALALDAAVPALTGAIVSDDPHTCGVVAVLLCQLIYVSEIENPPVPPILRAAADSLRGRLRHCDPVLRRYVLMTLLEENPTELLTPVIGDLLEEEHDPAFEPAGTANRAARRATIASLIARARARDPLIRRQLHINLLPKDILQSLMPKVRAALADENEDLRLQALLVISNLRSDLRSGLKSAAVETRSIVSALEIALTDRFPAVRELAAIILAELGPAARESRRAIQDAIANEHESTVRARMEEALQKLGSTGSAHVQPQ